METIYLILLIIAAVILVIGLIRIMISTPDSLGDLLLEMFLIDWMIDALSSIFEIIGSLFDGDAGDW